MRKILAEIHILFDDYSSRLFYNGVFRNKKNLKACFKANAIGYSCDCTDNIGERFILKSVD